MVCIYDVRIYIHNLKFYSLLSYRFKSLYFSIFKSFRYVNFTILKYWINLLMIYRNNHIYLRATVHSLINPYIYISNVQPQLLCFRYVEFNSNVNLRIFYKIALIYASVVAY